MTRLVAVRRNFPTLVLLLAPLRWAGKSRRRVFGTVVFLVALVAAPPLWWMTQLVGLPDIGEPFDTAKFRAVTIPDDRNAFVLYRQAAALLKPLAPYTQKTKGRIDHLASWSEALPEVRQWVEDNRPALAIYRQGTERPDALDVVTSHDRQSYKTIQALGSSFRLLALLEASRLEEKHDMAGAWGWYRALVRMSHHISMHGSISMRGLIARWHRQLADRLEVWSADSSTSPALLRQAIDDLTACESLLPSDRDSLMAGYLEAEWLLDSPGNPGHEVPLARFARFYNPRYTLNPEQLQSLWDTWRSLRREPERSRRVIRLLTANWLAYEDLPPERRPKPDPGVVSFDFYSLGPEAPASARAVSPQAMEAWFDSAYDAQKVFVYLNGSGVRFNERANDEELLMLVASELYRRDHGKEPPSPAVLVGPYLKRMPTTLPSGSVDPKKTAVDSLPKGGTR